MGFWSWCSGPSNVIIAVTGNYTEGCAGLWCHGGIHGSMNMERLYKYQSHVCLRFSTPLPFPGLPSFLGPSLRLHAASPKSLLRPQCLRQVWQHLYPQNMASHILLAASLHLWRDDGRQSHTGWLMTERAFMLGWQHSKERKHGKSSKDMSKCLPIIVRVEEGSPAIL